MKTIFTKLAIACSLIASQLANAQAPLLPLYENSTVKWMVFQHYKNGTCGSESVKNYYEILGDTVINGVTLKVLLNNRHITTSCTNSLLYDSLGNVRGYNYYNYWNTTRVYVNQIGNTFFYGHISFPSTTVDTSLHFSGTEVRDLVFHYGDTLLITNLDSIDYNGSRIRRFTLDKLLPEPNDYPSFYLDGIGFFGATNTNGEGGSILDCFSINGNSYSFAKEVDNIRHVSKPSSVISTTAMCQRPLNVESLELIKPSPRIFINQASQLETSQIASSIEIFNSKGQKVLENKDASITDISRLSNGFYIANITFANKQVKHKILVNN